MKVSCVACQSASYRCAKCLDAEVNAASIYEKSASSEELIKALTAQLVTFYEAHNPEKVAHAEMLVRGYRFLDIVKSLEEKYGKVVMDTDLPSWMAVLYPVAINMPTFCVEADGSPAKKRKCLAKSTARKCRPGDKETDTGKHVILLESGVFSLRRHAASSK